MALQDTDNLIVQRGTTLNKVQIQNMSTIQDADLLVVGRGSESYKITGKDFKDNIAPQGTVDKPSIISPADNAGEMVSAESDEITEWDESTKVLTLAGDKDLTVFQPLDDVVQDSGYTPQTSAITGVADTPANYSETLELYASGQGWSNLQNVEGLFDGNPSSANENRWSPHFYSLGDTATFTINKTCTNVTVYVSNRPESFELYADDLKIYSGNGSNFTWVGGNVPKGYISKLIFKSRVNSSYFSVSAVRLNGGTILADSDPFKVLTLTDDTDLANFRVGDVVDVTTTSTPNSTGPWVDAYTINSRDVPYNVISGPYDLSSDDIVTVSGNTGFIIEFAKLGPTFSITVERVKNGKDAMTKNYLDDANGFVSSAGGDTTITITESSKPVGATKLFVWPSSTGTLDVKITGTAYSVTSTDETVTSIDLVTNAMIVTGGSFTPGDVVTGPACTPATGTVASTDPAANTMTLSASDESGTKRWIVNAGKFVKGEETLSQDAAPDPSGLALQSSAFAATPPGSLAHTTSDWQITLKTDTTYANPVDQAIGDVANLTSWSPAGLENDIAYRCRVKHYSGATESDWSDDVTFKTVAKKIDLLPPSDVVLWEGGTTTSTTAVTVPGGIKFINTASNYEDQVGYGVDDHIYQISQVTGAVTDLGDFGSAMIGPDGNPESIGTGLIGYNGNGGIITQEGDLYFFASGAGYLPDPNAPKTHLLNAEADGGSGSSWTSDVCVAYSNKLQKVYHGYRNNVGIVIGTWGGASGDGWKEEPALYAQFFDPNPGQNIVQVAMTNSGTGYTNANHLYVLYADGRIAYNGTLTNVNDAKQMFIVNRSRNLFILTNDGDLLYANNNSTPTLTLTQIGNNDKFITAAAGSASGAVALGDDYVWYVVNPSTPTYKEVLKDPSGNDFTASTSSTTTQFNNWGSAVVHANNLKLVIPIT